MAVRANNLSILLLILLIGSLIGTAFASDYAQKCNDYVAECKALLIARDKTIEALENALIIHEMLKNGDITIEIRPIEPEREEY